MHIIYFCLFFWAVEGKAVQACFFLFKEGHLLPPFLLFFFLMGVHVNRALDEFLLEFSSFFLILLDSTTHYAFMLSSILSSFRIFYFYPRSSLYFSP